MVISTSSILSLESSKEIITLAPYLLIICFDNVHRISIDLIKENCFILKRQEAGGILL